MSLAAGVIAWLEFAMAKAETVDVYANALSLTAYPICAVIISMVWFIRFRLGYGRLWLAFLISGMWVAGILLDIISPDRDMISSVAISTQRASWGEVYTVGTASMPFLKTILFNLPTPLMAFFAADAGVQSYRNGAKREALIFAGAVFVFILVAGIHSGLVDSGIVQTPYMISIAFIAIAMALAFGLMDDVARAAATTRNLELQKRRWTALLEGIQLAAIRRDQNGRITYVNSFLQKLIDKPTDSILGKRVEDLAPQDSQKRHKISPSTEGLSEKSRSTGSTS
jgi:two-component system sensor kinase FixL